MFLHCSCKFEPKKTYYLKSNEEFYNRCLFISECPIYRNIAAKRFGICKKDGSRQSEIVYKNKAKGMIKRLIKEKISQNQNVSMPNGLRWGENKVLKINGKEIIRQTARDFNKGKEIISEKEAKQTFTL